jgi:mono/diheme cytochrome c family protein
MNRIVRRVSMVALPACALAAFLAGAIARSLAATALPAQDSQQVYLDKCAVCHAKDGSGNTAKGKKVKAKDLRSAEIKKMTDVELLDAVAKGKGKDMDGFQKELGADMVKQLVVYCRTLGGQ